MTRVTKLVVSLVLIALAVSFVPATALICPECELIGWGNFLWPPYEWFCGFHQYDAGPGRCVVDPEGEWCYTTDFCRYTRV